MLGIHILSMTSLPEECGLGFSRNIVCGEISHHQGIPSLGFKKTVGPPLHSQVWLLVGSGNYRKCTQKVSLILNTKSVNFVLNRCTHTYRFSLNAGKAPRRNNTESAEEKEGRLNLSNQISNNYWIIPIKKQRRPIMKVSKWLLTVTVSFYLCTPLFAQHEKGTTTIGIFGSAEKLVGGIQDNSAISPWFGLHFGYSLSPMFSFELNGGMGWDQSRDKKAPGIEQWVKLRPGTPFRTFLYPVVANLKFNVKPDSKINPYFAVGGGLLFWELRDISNENNLFPFPPSGKKVSGSQANALVNVGAGFEFLLSEKLGLDLSGRYQRLIDQVKDMSGFGDVQTGNVEARVGLNLYFGGWRDSDIDGIEDKMDQCPKKVEDFDGFLDADGCPDLDNDADGIADLQDKAPNQAEDLDGFEDTDGIPDLDNDADGIADLQDKAPNQAEDLDGFEDTDGIPDLDNDLDGIWDDKDNCPNEPETVNNYEDEDGCPDKEPAVVIDDKKPIVLEGVTFSSNSAELTENAPHILEAVFQTLVDYPEMEIEVRGHTDGTGNAMHNLRLSQKRAFAVRYYLVSRGIDPSRIRSIGFGEVRPIAPNSTRKGRAKNRRIEFIRIK
jgi:outer membrane protein OmpA-like peptidoglycan-associated protein